jgi:hypothetical protein
MSSIGTSARLIQSVVLTLCLGFNSPSTAVDLEDSNKSPRFAGHVGFPVLIEQVIIRGGEVEPIPIRDRDQPVIVRVVEVFPHGTDWRYDLEVQVLEPGEFDVAKFLQRKNEDDSQPIDPILVQTTTLLNSSVEPTELPPRKTGFKHYYLPILVCAGGLWLAGLLWILFYGRGKTRRVAIQHKPISLSDRLKPLIEAAIVGEISTEQQAELERLLTSFWSNRLRLGHLPASQLREALRNHSEAGKLLQRLDEWLYQPQPDRATASELSKLLEPYRSIPDEEF